ncbi:outer membrane lipoprotein-sorting protein [Pseudohongiella sp. O18]|uniref:outer membrane lipoprotein-sorting protein n=1 Tax=Pseudohongiella sp. O18 TaxID=2904248 RepID=UPI001F22CB42|nr:outer membrane lipoprotein-sorting protein [Pseudohongiella sp. O18]
MKFSLTILSLLTALPVLLNAADLDASARGIIEAVNAREDGNHVTRDATFELTDRRGITRVEKTTGYRKYFGDEKRTVIFYTEPSNVRGTGFLTWDYPDAGTEDDQWLYLPALGKVRRISASDRGDYFLGTDLTYDEIKKENKIEIDDYHYTIVGDTVIDGVPVTEIEAVPINEAVARELGYSRIVLSVDREIQMSRHSEYWDVNGNHLKTIHNAGIEQIDGIWTVTEVTVVNHKTNHKTRLLFENIDYQTDVPDRIFNQQMLERGLR